MDENRNFKEQPIYGIFLKPAGKLKNTEKDVMIFLSLSEEAAEAKIRRHALNTGNFKSQYYYRRVDQQEFDEARRILHPDDVDKF